MYLKGVTQLVKALLLPVQTPQGTRQDSGTQLRYKAFQ